MKKLLLILTTIGILLTCTACDITNLGRKAIGDTGSALKDIRNSFDEDGTANDKSANSWEKVQQSMGN